MNYQPHIALSNYRIHIRDSICEIPNNYSKFHVTPLCLQSKVSTGGI